MANYSAFVSHSMGQEDLAIVYSACHDAIARGIRCYIAEREWQFGQSLPQKIKNNIVTCDCFVAFLTVGGAYSQWVNQEIGYAVACAKPRILPVEDGVQHQGFDAANEFIALDRSHPWDAISKLSSYLSQLKLAKQQQDSTGLLVLGIIAFWGLWGRGR